MNDGTPESAAQPASRIEAPHRPPMRDDEEWVNALTHGFAAVMTLGLGGWLIYKAGQVEAGLAVACTAYIASAFGTFLCSTLSHVFLTQPLLGTLRAWDQAMIYAMISGTYTPIIYWHAPDRIRPWLLIAIWVAAFLGIFTKLIGRHRINNVTTVGYLLLGWLPAFPMWNAVPLKLALWTLLGGVLYSLGVVVLINDRKRPYLHAVWHLLVMTAALTHYLTIDWYVVDG
jgi:hemolysin III